MKSRFNLLVFLFCNTLILGVCVSLYGQNTTRKYFVQVVDSESKEPLPFATILINKNPHNGVVTNLNGLAQFFLSKKDSCIQVSYVGYETKVVPQAKIYQVVELKTVNVEIAGVVVYPSENPAHRIIRKVVANRKVNDPDRIPECVCNIYNKSTYDYTINDGFINDTTNQDFVDFIQKNHYLIMESATERFHKAPDKTLEKIEKVRVSGFKDPSFAPLSTDIQPFHFYNPLIKIFNITYLNPISIGSCKKYSFLIEDTLYKGSDTTFVISFKPRKNSNFEGLKGFLHINTNRYAIESVVASPAEKKLMTLRIQQNYEFKNGYWFPCELKSEVEWENINDQKIGIDLKSESYISNFSANVPQDSIKYTEEVLIFDKMATKNAEVAMEGFRSSNLSLKDLHTYGTMDSIGEKYKFDYWQRFLEKMMELKIPIGKFYIPLDKLYTYNKFEGNRLGFGLFTDDKLINCLEIGGWGAYGFNDQEWKYGTSIKLYFDRKRETSISASYSYDAIFPGNEDFSRKRNYIEGYFLQQADYSSRKETFFQIRIRYLQLQLSLMNDKRTPQYDYSFLLNNNWVNKYEVTEIGAQMRFAYREKYIWQFKKKVLIETKWPVLTVDYKKGLENFYGGEINYDKLWVQLNYSYHFPRFGKSNVCLEAGKVWGNVPYSFLFSGAGAWSNSMPVVVDNRFNTMSPNRFANNEIFSVYYSHNFGTLLFATSKWKPKVKITQAIGFGRLTNKQVHSGITLTDMSKGYYENGLIIGDILRGKIMNMYYLGLGLGGFYNYGYYSSPSWKENVKLKLNFNISF